MRIIGIDPGSSNGGIAVLYPDGRATACKMPQTPKDILDCLREAATENCRVFIERVGTMPSDSAKSASAFFRNIGWLEMALLALELPTESVPATKWQAGLSLPSLPPLPPRAKKSDGQTNEQKDALKAARSARSTASTARKNTIKAHAQQRFPSVKVTLATADALLIAEYGRRQELSMNGSTP